LKSSEFTLYEPDSPERIRVHSRSGKVPCLRDGSTIVWDSLSIAEYLAERHPGMWPADGVARAWARSATAEMHSGYSELRNEFGMNLRVRQKRKPSPAVASDIARIAALWREGRERFGRNGDFLWCVRHRRRVLLPGRLSFRQRGVVLAQRLAVPSGAVRTAGDARMGRRRRARDRAYSDARQHDGAGAAAMTLPGGE
jgi:hypothetical protein